MYFRQFLRPDLGCASYLLGSAATGTAVVVDPQWDITGYLVAAEERGLRITHIIETHNHADHVSGHGKLAAATGATIVIHEGAAPDYAHQAVRDGDTLRLGEIEIQVLHTPGHRPEHISLTVTDTTVGAGPQLVLTGDALFVGAVGRPDLAVVPAEGARALFHSLHDKLLRLPDSADLYPAHVAGSLCGKAMRPERHSTIGYERRHNDALQTNSEAAFVADVTSDLPPQPPHFQQIVARNRGALLTADPVVPMLTPAAAAQCIAEGAQVLDSRDIALFGEAHIPGAINVSLAGGGFPTRAAWVLDDAQPIVLVAADADGQAEALGALFAVGLDHIAGVLEGGMRAWAAAGQPVEQLPQMPVAALQAALATDHAPFVLDVRDADEWAGGHLAGAHHLPYQQVARRRAEVPQDRPVVVMCGAGYRASIAASLLQRAGWPDVANVIGGIEAWEAAGLPLVREA